MLDVIDPNRGDKKTSVEVNGNIIYLKGRRAKVNRRKSNFIRGLIVAGAIMLGGLGAKATYDIFSGDDVVTVTPDNTDSNIDINDNIEISLEEIPSVAFINDGIDDDQLREAVEKLQNLGLHCEYFDNIEDADLSDSYFWIGFRNYGGEKPKIIANYNEGNTLADNTAVALSSAYGYDVTDIQRGMYGDNSKLGPTSLEVFAKGKLVPMVEIAQPYEDDIDVTPIVEGLAKRTVHLMKVGAMKEEPALVRVNFGDPVSKEIRAANDIGEYDFVQGNTILKGKYYKEFDPNVEVIVHYADTKGNTLN